MATKAHDDVAALLLKSLRRGTSAPHQPNEAATRAPASRAARAKTPRAKTPRVGPLREKLGLTQQQFATLLGLSTVTVCRWERHNTKVTDSSKAMIELLGLALQRTAPEEVVAALSAVTAEDELGRILTLVRLGGG